MAVSLQNCAPGIFAFKYPISMGDEALGDAYCLVKEQIGDSVLVPIPDSCSLERVDNTLAGSTCTYILKFPLRGIDYTDVENIYFKARQILGAGKLICIPDSMSIQSADEQTLIGIKEVVEWRLRTIKEERHREQNETRG